MNFIQRFFRIALNHLINQFWFFFHFLMIIFYAHAPNRFIVYFEQVFNHFAGINFWAEFDRKFNESPSRLCHLPGEPVFINLSSIITLNLQIQASEFRATFQNHLNYEEIQMSSQSYLFCAFILYIIRKAIIVVV